MKKKTGKVREIRQSKKVGTMNLDLDPDIDLNRRLDVCPHLCFCLSLHLNLCLGLRLNFYLHLDLTQCHTDPDSNLEIGGGGGTLPNVTPTMIPTLNFWEYIAKCCSTLNPTLIFFCFWQDGGHITQCRSDPESNLELGGGGGGTLPSVTLILISISL